MKSKKYINTTQKLFPKEYSSLDKMIRESINIYEKSATIIDRTNIALGRKVVYKNITSSTLDTSIENNPSCSTYEV